MMARATPAVAKKKYREEEKEPEESNRLIALASRMYGSSRGLATRRTQVPDRVVQTMHSLKIICSGISFSLILHLLCALSNETCSSEATRIFLHLLLLVLGSSS